MQHNDWKCNNILISGRWLINRVYINYYYFYKNYCARAGIILPKVYWPHYLIIDDSLIAAGPLQIFKTRS